AGARQLLGFLTGHQLADGSFYDAMYQATGSPASTARSSGNQAWALYAMAFYIHQTGDTRYIPMANRLANWLMARQDPADGGITGGINPNGSVRTWTSTEHNIDAYFAFKLYRVVTDNPVHLNTAHQCRDWLLNVAWNDAEQRFNTGENDPSRYLDPQTLGVLFMNDIGDFAKRDSLLTYIEQNFATEKTFTNGSVTQTYYGFEYAWQDASFWWEGVEQTAVAYGHAGNNTKKEDYMLQLIRSDEIGRLGSDNDGDGGFQYALEAGTQGLSTEEQPSPGLWLIFAINGYMKDHPSPY
ncbi:MAG: hypothetical protein ABH845_03395, partial [Candidatus Omnitrophota bacterium]